MAGKLRTNIFNKLEKVVHWMLLLLTSEPVIQGCTLQITIVHRSQLALVAVVNLHSLLPLFLPRGYGHSTFPVNQCYLHQHFTL